MQELYQTYPQDLNKEESELETTLKAIQPGEFRDVDAPGGNIRDSFHDVTI
jgi:hypothetical protein